LRRAAVWRAAAVVMRATRRQGHQQAVSLFQSYAQNGGNPALKRWTVRTLPTLQKHLNMAEKLS